MAQLHFGTQQQAVANLATLAGVSWVRDRFWWRELEPVKTEFAKKVSPDDSANAQAEAGLQVLQVYCDTPEWAGKNAKRFPSDLRDAYQFMKSVAARWRGKVLAVEPWNEADTPNFGGHIGSEIAAYQKACYLGLKAGNPDVIVSQNVFASPHPNVLADFNANEVWAYFDTFNFHHYCPPEEYRGVYTAFRKAAAGKPLWVTEFNLPVTWSGDEQEQEPSAADLRLQAERVGQLFAATLHENPAVAFYFLLSHYTEGQVQYGVLRKDLTPRPAYLALAAVGRILADARSLGRLHAGNTLQAFGFRARSSGEERDVLVVWTTGSSLVIELPMKPVAIYDHLGRAHTNVASSLKLSPAPLFVVCQKDALRALSMQAPRPSLPLKLDKPTSVVMQAVLPEEKIEMSLSAYRCSSTNPETISLFAYNFSDQRVSGVLRVDAPSGWRINFPKRVELAPGERKELKLSVDARGATTTPSDTIRVSGDFAGAGESLLSFRLAPQPFTILKEATFALTNANDISRWQKVSAPGSTLSATNAVGGVTVQAQFKNERWAFPVFALNESERATTNSIALSLTVTVAEGAGNFRVIFEEENRSAYFAPFYPQPKAGETIEILAMLDAALHGEGWSNPDDDEQLNPEKIRALRIGCNAETEKVGFTIKNLRWVRREAR